LLSLLHLAVCGKPTSHPFKAVAKKCTQQAMKLLDTEDDRWGFSFALVVDKQVGGLDVPMDDVHNLMYAIKPFQHLTNPNPISLRFLFC
jgi:hypothetical protein